MRRLLPLTLLLAACAAPGRVRTFDGLEVAVDDRGAGEPALIFLPGWCCEKGQWAAQLEAFASERRVVAIDLPGHGASGTGRERWSMLDYPRDVEAVCDALGIEQAVLVGHSMGGPVALLAAARMPGRVVGVIGVDSLQTVQFDYTDEALEPFVTGLQAGVPEFMAGFVGQGFAPDADPAVVQRVIDAADAVAPPVAIGLMKSFTAYEPRAALAACPVPVVCVNGTLMMRTDVAGNRAHDPDFAVIEMEGRGHWPMLEDPAGFNANLRAALAHLEQPMLGLSPILTVDSIEPCLALWERLGFARVAEVPGEDGLAFVMLNEGPVSVMYQTHASLAADLPALADEARASRQHLYIKVASLDAVRGALEGHEVVVPERETFYGAREIVIRDAAGHVLVFAADVVSADG